MTATLGGPRRTTKADSAYYEIRRKVLEGELAPGSVVEQEALAKELGISTTPLREALRRLEALGLLRQVAHREMRIAPLSVKEITDLYALRIRLEAYAARLGAKHASAEQRWEIRGLLEEPVAGTKVGQLEQNRGLHRAMYAAGGNHALAVTLDQLWDRADRYRAILLRDNEIADTIHAEHSEIVDAFCDAQEAQIARLTKAHLESGRVRLLSVIAKAEQETLG
ncbi:GntR family transcriptional regulator [Nocardia sp. NPDC004278]